MSVQTSDSANSAGGTEPSSENAAAAAAAPDRPGTDRRPRVWRHEWLTATATPLVFALLLVVAFGIWLGGEFLQTQNRMFDVYQSVPPLLISIGVVVALCAGQFDLSAGTMATLATFLTVGLATNQNMPLWAVIIVVGVVGIAGGLLNGLLVVGMRINAFIATLGTGGVFTGISVLYGSGQTISFSSKPGVLKEVSWFTGPTSLGSFQKEVPIALAWVLVVAVLLCMWTALRLVLATVQRTTLRDVSITVLVVAIGVFVQVAGIPREIDWTISILVVAAIAVWVVMRQTRLGRNIYATGGNPTAARLAGIKTDRLMVLVFVASSFFAAMGGVVLAADQGTAVPNIADGFLLPAYAAAFLSTVIFSSGRFHIWGTIAGGLAVVYIAQGLVTGGVPFTWTDLINGAVLIVAVALSTTLRRAIIRR